MVRLQTLDLRIGVRVPASQPNEIHSFPVSNLQMNRAARSLAWLLTWSQLVFGVVAWAAQNPQRPASTTATAAPQAQSNSGAQTAPAANGQAQQPHMVIVPPPSPFDPKPPAGMEDALRDRIAKFYQCYVDDKVRRSEEYVNPDERDAYYTIEKPHYFGFKILEIRFKDDFTRADAVLLIDKEIAIPGQDVLRLSIPVPSHWILVDGVWYYTLTAAKPGETVMTPFGPQVVPDPKDILKPKVLFTKDDVAKRVEEAQKAIVQLDKAPQPSKKVAELGPGTGYRDEIEVFNGSPSTYHFQVIGTELPQGLVIDPMQGELKANSSVRLKFSVSAADAAKIGQDFPKVTMVMDGTGLSVALGIKILGPNAPQ